MPQPFRNGGEHPTRHMRPIFQGRHIHVFETTLPSDSNLVVVTFPARTNRQGLARKGFGLDFLQKKNLPGIFVTVNDNHWFQTEEAGPALASISEITGRFSRIVTYGSSMGGYAALAWSGRLNASAVIAVSPQFSIDRDRVPWERRWAEEAKQLAFQDDNMAGNVSQTALIHLIYDPFTPDVLHARLLEGLAQGFQAVRVPFGGHPAGAFLKESGLISRVMTGLISGSLSSRDVRNAIRTKRRSSALYWINLAESLRRRRSPSAVDAARRAYDLAPDDHSVCFLLGRFLRRIGEREEAIVMIEKATRLRPTTQRYQDELRNMTLR